MAIDIDVAKFLFSAREQKIDFQKSLMIGSQKLDLPEAKRHQLSKTYDVEDFLEAQNSTDFFHLLGAKEVSAMDISDYEGAEILHDLNVPIGKELEEKFSLVLDGGAIEHIFNFPVAIANLMKMVKIGGHLVTITAANNFLGHGFYQFSPELFYRTLSSENGFRVKRMILAEVGGNWYEVADPLKIKGRVELINDQPVYIMVLSEKIDSRMPFEKTPQQSDYVAIWEKENEKKQDENSSNKIKELLKKNKSLYQTLTSIKQKQINKSIREEMSFANNKAYKLVDK